MDYHRDRPSSTDGSYPELEEYFGPEVLNLPVGSFAEDSPSRACDNGGRPHSPLRSKGRESSRIIQGTEEHPRRASTPRASPGPDGRVMHSYSSYGTPYNTGPPQYYRKSPRGGAQSSYPHGQMHYYSSDPRSQQRAPSHYSAPPPHSSPQNPPHNNNPHSHAGHYSYPPSHPGMGYPPPYYSYPHHHGEPWSSPRPYEPSDSAYPPPSVHRMHETGKNLEMEKDHRSPPSTTASTPEKPKMMSPFRSPVPPSTGKSFAKSPMYHMSPHIGTYGSFGIMDTPGGTITGDFSPMGPSFTGFADDDVIRRTHSSDGASFEAKLDFSRSDSSEMGGAPIIKQRGSSNSQLHAESPFTGFIKNEFSPFPGEGGLQGVPRSPLRSERRCVSTKHTLTSEHSRTDRPSMPALDSTKSSHEGHILTSPLEPSSGAKPRKLWRDSGEPACPVRLELGGSSGMQKSLEGINSMMRGQGGPRHSNLPSRGHTFPHGGYRPDMNTPIKTPAMSGSRPPVPRFPSSNSKQTPGYHSSTKSFSRGVDGKVPSSSGKENATPNGKRHPCNCKKSKCLKLYCECFAAEQFCEGCNCSDCRNIPTYSNVRDKAIKDTRTKNPNAFKPRITVKNQPGISASPQGAGHNMGCRCKRSECLKKYCECFQAGVMCGNKCKCVECMNYAGSQKLIDKRRKIKDQRGADFAMRVAEQAWKGQPSSRKPPNVPPAAHLLPSPAATPSGRLSHMTHPSMMHPSPAQSRHPRGPPPPPHYMPHHMMGPPPMGHMGYSPMGLPHVSPGYGDPRVPQSDAPHRPVMYKPPPHHRPTSVTSASKRKNSDVSTGNGSSNTSGNSSCSSSATKKTTNTTELPPPLPPKISPAPATPRTPAVRVSFDAASSRKKRKLGNSPEPSYPDFGPKMPHQPKTTSLAIFSFLSNNDLYNSALVCKRWKCLAMDEELWKF